MNIVPNDFFAFYITSASSLNGSYTMQLIKTIVVFILLIYAFYFLSKYLKKNNINLYGNKSNNLEIVDKLGIGIGCYIAIVKCGTRFFLVSITKEKINFLSEVNESDLNLDNFLEDKKDGKTQFSTIYNNMIKKKNEDKDEEEI
ncbi:MAG: flagellar biosynthetic protein FliO [Lachnospirales bacterium]